MRECSSQHACRQRRLTIPCLTSVPAPWRVAASHHRAFLIPTDDTRKCVPSVPVWCMLSVVICYAIIHIIK